MRPKYKTLTAVDSRLCCDWQPVCSRLSPKIRGQHRAGHKLSSIEKKHSRLKKMFINLGEIIELELALRALKIKNAAASLGSIGGADVPSRRRTIAHSRLSFWDPYTPVT